MQYYFAKPLANVINMQQNFIPKEIKGTIVASPGAISNAETGFCVTIG
jgi:hypothetical protein